MVQARNYTAGSSCSEPDTWRIPVRSIIAALLFTATTLFATSSSEAQCLRLFANRRCSPQPRCCQQPQSCPQPQCCQSAQYVLPTNDKTRCLERCAIDYGPGAKFPCEYCYMLCKNNCPDSDPNNELGLKECIHDGTNVTSYTICVYNEKGELVCDPVVDISIPCESAVRCCPQPPVGTSRACSPRCRLFGWLRCR